MLDMIFEVASTIFMATLAGLFMWFVLSDGNPPEYCNDFEERSTHDPHMDT